LNIVVCFTGRLLENRSEELTTEVATLCYVGHT